MPWDDTTTSETTLLRLTSVAQKADAVVQQILQWRDREATCSWGLSRAGVASQSDHSRVVSLDHACSEHLMPGLTQQLGSHQPESYLVMGASRAGVASQSNHSTASSLASCLQ